MSGTTLGDPRYDWAFMSVPQKHANNRRIFHPRYVSILTRLRTIVLTVVQWKGFRRVVASKWKYLSFCIMISRTHRSISWGSTGGQGSDGRLLCSSALMHMLCRASAREYDGTRFMPYVALKPVAIIIHPRSNPGPREPGMELARSAERHEEGKLILLLAWHSA